MYTTSSGINIRNIYLHHLCLVQGSPYHDRWPTCPWCKHFPHGRRPHHFTLQGQREEENGGRERRKVGGRGTTYWWVTEQKNELIDIWKRAKFSVNTISSASGYLRDCLPEGPRAQLLETGCAVSFTLCIGGAGDRERQGILKLSILNSLRSDYSLSLSKQFRT